MELKRNTHRALKATAWTAFALIAGTLTLALTTPTSWPVFIITAGIATPALVIITLMLDDCEISEELDYVFGANRPR